MKQQVKKERITKVEFHRLGGFGNPILFRLQSRGGAWRYYQRINQETGMGDSFIRNHTPFADER